MVRDALSAAGGGGARSRGGSGGAAANAAAAAATKALEHAKQLRKLVAVADDVQRSGRRGNLQLWVWRLWHRVAQVLESDPCLLAAPGPGPSPGPEYLMLLSRHLLPTPEYCRHLRPHVAEALLQSLCYSLKALAQGGADAASSRATGTAQLAGPPVRPRPAPPSRPALGDQQLLTVLTSLLVVWPADLAESHANAVQSALRATAKWLARVGDTSRPSLALLGAALQLLAAAGLDGGAPHAARLHAGLRPLLRLVWGETRTPGLRETVARYCLLQLQLGGLDPEAAEAGPDPGPGPDGRSRSLEDAAAAAAGGGGAGGGGANGALLELYGMAVRDVSGDVSSWLIDADDGSLAPLAAMQLQLLAGLFFAVQQAHSTGKVPAGQLTHGSGPSAGGAGSGSDGGGFGDGSGFTAPPAKRRRQLPPLEWLLEQVEARPARPD
ncbi:hypothetical protein GPECTOR_13g631 [Gonium pectorale]|uniref:Uncharacterized protein n=1 Tax=Gonium pectorale TaxID=33097 RepID=A0A150GMW5_GONPE|nr:hypothetical protein GPECTOR_13g631 [Gonium pectorale]|eukprot:KXZ51144.1 hypothetical protein GPECTOR_13g631 [Gonium pectorale]